MHEIPVSHILLALGADGPFLLGIIIPILRRDQLLFPAVEMLAQILDNHRRLGQHKRLGRRAGRLEGDDGRLAQRVDLLELGGCEEVGAALEGLEVVGEVEFFKEPEDALGAGFFEPGELLEGGWVASTLRWWLGDVPVEGDLGAVVVVVVVWGGHFAGLLDSVSIRLVGKVLGWAEVSWASYIEQDRSLGGPRLVKIKCVIAGDKLVDSRSGSPFFCQDHSGCVLLIWPDQVRPEIATHSVVHSSGGSSSILF